MSKFKAYPMSEKDLKCLELGKRTKVLIEMYLEDPKKFKTEFILEQLLEEYARQELDLKD